MVILVSCIPTAGIASYRRTMDGGKSEIHDRDARYEITVGMYPGLFTHVPLHFYLSVFIRI